MNDGQLEGNIDLLFVLEDGTHVFQVQIGGISRIMQVRPEDIEDDP